MPKNALYLLALLTLFMGSCVPIKRLTYLQENEAQKSEDLDALAKALMNSDPHYKIIGFLDLTQNVCGSSREVKKNVFLSMDNQEKSRLDTQLIPLVSLAEFEGFIK